MADGREHVESIHTILGGLVTQLDGRRDSGSEHELAELQKNLQAAQNSVRMCRGKVWLRGKEGTEMAHKCLEAAQVLQGGFQDLSVSVGASTDLAMGLEAMARVVASKSQVLT